MSHGKTCIIKLQEKKENMTLNQYDLDSKSIRFTWCDMSESLPGNHYVEVLKRRLIVQLHPQVGQSKSHDKSYGPNIHVAGNLGGSDKPCNAYRYWSVTIIDRPSSQKYDMDTSKYTDWIEWIDIDIDYSQDSPHNKSGSTKQYMVHTHKSSTEQ